MAYITEKGGRKGRLISGSLWYATTCNFNYDLGKIRHLDQGRFVVKISSRERPKERLAVLNKNGS